LEGNLDLQSLASQTRCMAHIYLAFDFGADEEKAQQARHKLDGWKQAFRLDKKLLYKFDRGDDVPADTPPEPEKKEKSSKGAKSKTAKSEKTAESSPAVEKIKLLLRLAFSNHEKLSEQRWVERIPGEEPFKGASPVAVRPGEPSFDEIETRFDGLD
jgi:hypothetical protein